MQEDLNEQVGQEPREHQEPTNSTGTQANPQQADPEPEGLGEPQETDVVEGLGTPPPPPELPEPEILAPEGQDQEPMPPPDLLAMMAADGIFPEQNPVPETPPPVDPFSGDLSKKLLKTNTVSSLFRETSKTISRWISRNPVIQPTTVTRLRNTNPECTTIIFDVATRAMEVDEKVTTIAIRKSAKGLNLEPASYEKDYPTEPTLVRSKTDQDDQAEHVIGLDTKNYFPFSDKNGSNFWLTRTEKKRAAKKSEENGDKIGHRFINYGFVHPRGRHNRYLVAPINYNIVSKVVYATHAISGISQCFELFVIEPRTQRILKHFRASSEFGFSGIYDDSSKSELHSWGNFQKGVNPLVVSFNEKRSTLALVDPARAKNLKDIFLEKLTDFLFIGQSELNIFNLVEDSGHYQGMLRGSFDNFLNTAILDIKVHREFMLIYLFGKRVPPFRKFGLILRLVDEKEAEFEIQNFFEIERPEIDELHLSGFEVINGQHASQLDASKDQNSPKIDVDKNYFYFQLKHPERLCFASQIVPTDARYPRGPELPKISLNYYKVVTPNTETLEPVQEQSEGQPEARQDENGPEGSQYGILESPLKSNYFIDEIEGIGAYAHFLDNIKEARVECFQLKKID